ncbi:hypothetical protein CRM22_006988 [Opisthorchis felineus]|uniref:Uncharacterized protein n=1 Tax=Opisthorchis felineus TaxID=147828 RepID=A0A4S2LQ09_OPIFE|nr:hypothetical protein CRM22_006988 [Opisthorchis felineus]TGZ63330.1 hypothetical protein CRM22_006988 [Opisthorchis felineus]
MSSRHHLRWFRGINGPQLCKFYYRNDSNKTLVLPPFTSWHYLQATTHSRTWLVILGQRVVLHTSVPSRASKLSAIKVGGLASYLILSPSSTPLNIDLSRCSQKLSRSLILQHLGQIAHPSRWRQISLLGCNVARILFKDVTL